MSFSGKLPCMLYAQCDKAFCMREAFIRPQSILQFDPNPRYRIQPALTMLASISHAPTEPNWARTARVVVVPS